MKLQPAKLNHKSQPLSIKYYNLTQNRTAMQLFSPSAEKRSSLPSQPLRRPRVVQGQVFHTFSKVGTLFNVFNGR